MGRRKVLFELSEEEYQTYQELVAQLQAKGRTFREFATHKIKLEHVRLRNQEAVRQAKEGEGCA